MLQTEHPYHFIPHIVLGEIYNEVEQTSDSVRSYEAALLSMQKLPSAQTWKYYHYLIVIYNNLGLSNLNRDENETGLGCLARAEQVYQAFKEVPGEDVYHNRSYEAKGRTFHLLYEGGIDHEQIEDSYTLTLFYLAQAYTKIGLKDKAAESCGLTLQRQYSTGKY